MTTRMAAQLWAAPVCPWAQRATIAVVETGAPFEYKTVDLHNKSEEFVSLYRRVVCDAGATAKVGAAHAAHAGRSACVRVAAQACPRAA